MRILVINPILYTAETKQIKRASSIQDTMMYDLCLAFHRQGHRVTLFAGEPYRPTEEETYPFPVLWGKCVLPSVLAPHRFPVMPELWRYIRENKGEIDLILSSEVFSANSLMAFWLAPKKLVIWHELAKHNALMHRIPSKIWYNLVARFAMGKAKIVARSQEARAFISRYCANVDSRVVDHGVNLEKFCARQEKENYFVVCSQLIDRKRIDGILRKFADYTENYDPRSKLYIIGNGPRGEDLKALARDLGLTDRVIFTGRLDHGRMMPILAGAQALLVNTEKDNNMVSIVESIGVGTPIVTTDVPLNASYIRANALGIVRKAWEAEDLREIVANNSVYVHNCLQYREQLSTRKRVEQLLQIYEAPENKGK